MLLNLLACLPLLAPAPQDATAQDVAPPAPTYVGAGFSLSPGDGLEISETGNGQVYFLEVRRAGQPDDAAEPLVKLLILPGASPQLETNRFLEMLGTELVNTRAAAGQTLATTEDIIRRIGQLDRLGKRLVFREASPVETVDLFTFAEGPHLFAVLVKVPVAATTAVEAVLESLLPTIVVNPIDANTTRVETLGPFQVDVPFQALEQRPDNAQLEVLQLGLPEGMLELIHQQLSAPWEASLATADYLAQRRTMIRETAAAAGGVPQLPTWTALWVGDGLLVGERMQVPLEGGDPTEVLSFSTTAGAHILGAGYEAAPPRREAMHAAARSLLSSLRTSPGRADLRLDLGQRRMRQDLGLSWVYPDKLELTVVPPADASLPTRLSLADPFAGSLDRISLNEYFADVHTAPLVAPARSGESGAEDDPLAALRAEVRQLAVEAYPDAELGTSYEIATNLLGERRPGLTLHFVQDDVPMQLSAISVPHRGGELVAGACYPASDAGSALWTLANLLARLSALPDGPRGVTSVDWTMTFDPADWTLASRLGTEEHQAVLEEKRGSARVEVLTRRWVTLDAERDFEALRQRAEADFDAYRSDPALKLGLPTGTEVELQEQVDCLPLGGTLAMRCRMLLRPADQDPVRLDAWTLRTTDHVVHIVTRADAGDADSLAAIDALVESLVLATPQVQPPTPAVAAGLELLLPPGTWATSYTRAGSTYLDVSSRFVEKESLVVRTETLDPGVDRAALEEQSRQALELMAGLLNDGATPGEEEVLTATFAGQTVPRWRRANLDAEGRERSTVELLLLVHEGVLYEVSLFSDRALGGDAWRTFEATLASAILLPRLAHDPEDAPKDDPMSAAGPVRTEVLELGGLRLALQVAETTKLEALANVAIASSTEEHATSVVRLRSHVQPDGLNALVLLDLVQAEDCVDTELLEQVLVTRTLLGQEVEGRRLRLRQPDGSETLLDLYALEVGGVSLTIEATRWPDEDQDHVGGLPAIDLALDSLRLATE